jgi:hypothetical protein
VTTTVAEDALARGFEALAAGEWSSARDAFREALDVTDAPEALDGLGRALWWLRDERGAVVHRERAYAGFRRDGELARAARIALWLAREYGLAFGNDAASRGWLARAERLLRDVSPGAEQGWLDLTRATPSTRRPWYRPLSTLLSPRATRISSFVRSPSSALPRSLSVRPNAASPGLTKRWPRRPAASPQHSRRSPTSAAR